MNKSVSQNKLTKILPLILVYVVAVVLAVVANFIKPGFLSASNIENLLRQSAFLGIICIGQTLVILTGGIDISADNMVVLANVVAANIMSGSNVNVFKAFIVVILIGLILGLINGIGVHYLNIPAIVMTLATGNILHGAAYIYCKGAPVGKTAPIIANLVNGKIGGILNGVTFVWIALSIVCIVMLRYTVFGRSIYAVGTSSLVSWYSGIRSSLTTISAYVISGVMAAVTGLFLVGYTGSSYLSIGGDYEASSIAAVVAGGTLIIGGRGSYGGTIAGVLIMTIVASLMNMLNINDAGRKIFQGLIIVVLLLAVYAKGDTPRKRLKRSTKVGGQA